MDGIHDLGGKQGFGGVDTNDPIPPLPEHWQGFVFALVQQLYRLGVSENVDHFRHSVERISPAAYLSDGYYGRWLGAAETMLVEKGLITQEELNQAVGDLGSTHPPAARPSFSPDNFPARNEDEERPRTALRDVLAAPKFQVDTTVQTQHHGKPGHTRLPAYARGVVGVVVAHHQAWVYPDTHAHGQGEAPEHLYTVRFWAQDLFGGDCEEGTEVYIDLFEPYLDSI